MSGPTSEGSNIVRLAAAKQIERTPPFSDESERAVLGSLLIQPEAIGECLEKLGVSVAERRGAEFFYDPRHQVLFETLVEMYDVRQAVDPITLKQRLTDKNALETVGGETYLHELYGCMATASNVFYYLEIVRDQHLRRRLIEVGSRIVADSYESRDESAEKLADRVDKMVFEITQNRMAKEAVHVKQIVPEAMRAIEEAVENKGKVRGIASGFKDLDKLTGGFRGGDMIVVAARPSKGKTALAMNIVEHAALTLKLPVAVFSLEMTQEQLVLRMVSSLAKVDSSKMRDGSFTNDRDHMAIMDAMNLLTKSQIYIDDSGALPITLLRAKARRLKLQRDIKLFVIDYMQLLHGATRRGSDSRAQEVAEISGGIKALAKELKVPFIVISQLNREVEKREDGRPRLADLRESGAIEQDADVVLLLARGSAGDGDKEADDGIADLVIAKQRNGPTGNVPLTFLKQYTRFVERAKTDEEYRTGVNE